MTIYANLSDCCVQLFQFESTVLRLGGRRKNGVDRPICRLVSRLVKAGWKADGRMKSTRGEWMKRPSKNSSRSLSFTLGKYCGHNINYPSGHDDDDEPLVTTLMINPAAISMNTSNLVRRKSSKQTANLPTAHGPTPPYQYNVHLSIKIKRYGPSGKKKEASKVDFSGWTINVIRTTWSAFMRHIAAVYMHLVATTVATGSRCGDFCLVLWPTIDAAIFRNGFFFSLVRRVEPTKPFRFKS